MKSETKSLKSEADIEFLLRLCYNKSMDPAQKEHITSLILKIGKGDEDALFALYLEIGGRMLSVATGITGDRQLAEDAVQESLIKIVKYAKSFRRSENGYGWVCTVVRNESLTILKKYKNRHADIDEFYHLSDTRQKTDWFYQKADIEAAMLRLSEKERQMIYLHYLCDKTVREIGHELSLPKSTVAYTIKKAEEKLREYLKLDNG